MAKKYTGTLSKNLPGGRVTVPAGSEKRSYYKYYLEPFEDISDELKEKIRGGVFKKGEGLEIADRTRLQEEKAFPTFDGYYPLKGGGAVSVANIKVPDITGEMIAWWAAWHGIEPLRYAIWDNQDHYSVEVIENRERLFDDSIPVRERVWGTRHKILESFVGDVPGALEMRFLSPWECGFDKSLDGTDRLLYFICAQACIGKIPVFATEGLVKGEDGINEARCRFWIGYERQADGSFKCKLPPFIKPPKDLVHRLIMHNHREFTHLNKILPRIYEEEKDNWA